MKYKFLIAVFSVFLATTYSVFAEADGYTVKFKTIPENIDNFEVVHQATNMYRVESKEQLSGLWDYIEFVEENQELEITLPVQTAPRLRSIALNVQYLWHFEMTNPTGFWENAAYGNEIRVGIIDSGCYPHNDLQAALLPGKNFLSGGTNTSDDHGHGTHLAGIIAASAGTSGTMGIAPKAKIVPIKCFSATKTPTNQKLANAITSAVDDFGCRVINMSWGFSNDSQAIKTAIDYAYSKGAILVSAAGNNGSSAISYPAGWDNVISVASVNTDKTHSYFSQYNSTVDVSAPGNTILSTSNTGSYEYMYGTSQAAPHISGIAALALSLYPELTNAEFKTLLTETCEDLGDKGYDVYYGHGLANAQALLVRLFEIIPHYVSPVNTENGESYVLIRNNDTEPLVAESIFAGYAGGRFSSAIKTPVSLMPGHSITIPTSISSPRHFLWNSLKKITPVHQSR